jgi:DNA-binding GntR family transcriptional regulator
VTPVPSSGDPLSRRTLADQIAERLRLDILFGAISPDERLTQEGICRRFNTSRIPVRDAIQRLTHDGLIESTKQGLRVVVPTREDYDDMFLIEGHLHGLAAGLLIARATDEEIEALSAINDEMHAAIDRHDYESAAWINGRFHRQINRLSKSRQLLRTLRVISPRIDNEYLAHYPERSESAVKEHDDFLAAVRAGDASTAAEILRAHVQTTFVVPDPRGANGPDEHGVRTLPGETPPRGTTRTLPT